MLKSKQAELGDKRTYEILCGHRYKCPRFSHDPDKTYVVTPKEMMEIVEKGRG